MKMGESVTKKIIEIVERIEVKRFTVNSFLSI
jgi:hypothetical protein